LIFKIFLFGIFVHLCRLAVRLQLADENGGEQAHGGVRWRGTDSTVAAAEHHQRAERVRGERQRHDGILDGQEDGQRDPHVDERQEGAERLANKKYCKDFRFFENFMNFSLIFKKKKKKNIIF
jgi:hypothetical protein